MPSFWQQQAVMACSKWPVWTIRTRKLSRHAVLLRKISLLLRISGLRPPGAPAATIFLSLAALNWACSKDQKISQLSILYPLSTTLKMCRLSTQWQILAWWQLASTKWWRYGTSLLVFSSLHHHSQRLNWQRSSRQIMNLCYLSIIRIKSSYHSWIASARLAPSMSMNYWA